ncbi:hypothetical protein [Gulosibacter sp.]|uniref:hypothetical protein n=1 Tax=Gulosibacter sp. TaxID=2817531 RepID=UPI003F8F11EA
MTATNSMRHPSPISSSRIRGREIESRDRVMFGFGVGTAAIAFSAYLCILLYLDPNVRELTTAAIRQVWGPDTIVALLTAFTAVSALTIASVVSANSNKLTVSTSIIDKIARTGAITLAFAAGSLAPLRLFGMFSSRQITADAIMDVITTSILAFGFSFLGALYHLNSELLERSMAKLLNDRVTARKQFHDFRQLISRGRGRKIPKRRPGALWCSTAIASAYVQSMLATHAASSAALPEDESLNLGIYSFLAATLISILIFATNGLRGFRYLQRPSIVDLIAGHAIAIITTIGLAILSIAFSQGIISVSILMIRMIIGSTVFQYILFRAMDRTFPFFAIRRLRTTRSIISNIDVNRLFTNEGVVEV